MAVSIAAVMRRVRNYFERGYRQGTFSIVGNVLSPAVDAPMIAVTGSRYHDGVYASVNGIMQGAEGVKPDETFEGIVWKLYPPDDFLDLCKKISIYDDKNPVGALASESFGDYSYTRDTNMGMSGAGWANAFAPDLAAYRRMFTEVNV